MTTLRMLCFVYGFLFSVHFISYECEGKITSAPDREYLFLPGQTAEIKWEFDDEISTLVVRSWSYKNGSYTHRLATIVGDGSTNIETQLFEVYIKKPATLVLKNINQGYNGVYQFALTSTAAFISDVEVSIASAPTVKLSCPCRNEVDEGKNFTCVCSGEGGVPAPANVTWYKNGVQIGETKKENNTLTLNNVNVTHNGTYKCVAQSYPTDADENAKSIHITVNLTSTTIQPSTATTPQPSTNATTVTTTVNSTTRQPSASATNVTTTGTNDASSGTEWHIVVASLLSGIFLASSLV